MEKVKFIEMKDGDKEDYELLLTFEGKYNRLVLFNGKKFYHGADVYYSPIKRFNQVLFFTDEP